MIYILIILLSISTQQQSRISTDFTLTTISYDNTTIIDVVRGKLFIFEKPLLLFEVTEPLYQLMWVKRDTIDIYYPDDNKFFRILTHDTLPSHNTQISQMVDASPERQLRNLGFNSYSNETSGDTLLIEWEKRGMPEVTTGYIGDDLVVYRSSGLGWSLEFKFWDYQSIAGHRYPHILRSTIKVGKVIRTEQLHFAEIQVNQPLPQHLVDLTIPEDVEMKISEW